MRALLTSIISFFTLILGAQTLHFHQLTVKDGLPHNSIITLAQDKKGDIWVATHGGLMIYDGKTFHKLPDNELPDKRVDRMNCAPDGTMWVQCFEHHQQTSRYDTLTHHFVTYNVSDLDEAQHQQAVQPLNRTFADPRSSRTWTIEKRQLVQTDTLKAGSAFTYTGQTALDAGLKDEIFYSLLLDRQGILWAGSANNGLFFAETHLSHYHRLACQPSPLVRATCMDSKGTLWIAIGDKQLLTLPKGANVTTSVNYPMTDSIEGRRLRAIVEDDKGRIWLGGHDGLYVKEASAAVFNRVDMGSNVQAHVFCLHQDMSNQLWIGSDQGLHLLKLDEQPLKAQLVDSTVTSISKIAADKDRLWLATENGLYCRVDGKITPWYQQAAHAIVIDARGQIWVGTDNGLLRVTEHGVEHVNSAADGHIVKALLCWRDFLWCSYEQGLCCMNIYTGQSTELHTEHNEYLDGSACIDVRTGTLYFGGTEGIDCLQADNLDEQLRSGRPQLWLDEVEEVLLQQQEQQAMPTENTGTPWWVFVFIGLAVLILAAVVVLIVKKNKKEVPQSPEEEKTPAEPSPFVVKATAIVNAHMSDTEFTAEQLAQEMAMSRTKMFLLMKKETGKAAMEFVRDIRLEYAADQLKKGAQVTEIASACGFSDPSSFRRSFVRKFGINPSQFRSL